jgi:hypothetical protein
VQRQKTQRNDVDKLTMLLSTDWFSSYWASIGIVLETKGRAAVQQGCRKIVKQIISGAQEYWLVSFSPERVQQTRLMLQDLFRNVKPGEAVLHRVNALVSGVRVAQVDDGSTWLLTHLTQMLLNDSQEIADIKLDLVIKRTVSAAWEQLMIDLENIDFRALSEDSQSEWDKYIRSLTPDLPTYLCDYLMISILGESKFEFIWDVVRRQLNAKQRRELLDWYRAAARSVTGGEVTFAYLGDTVQ